MIITGLFPFDFKIKEAALLYTVKKVYPLPNTLPNNTFEKVIYFLNTPHPANEFNFEYNCFCLDTLDEYDAELKSDSIYYVCRSLFSVLFYIYFS